MDLWQVPRAMNRMMNEYMRDFDRLERSLYPYWREADHSVLHVANETQQVFPTLLSAVQFYRTLLSYCR